VNGLIASNRPRGSEATARKNPVSHVRKIYNVLAHLPANRRTATRPGSLMLRRGVPSSALMVICWVGYCCGLCLSETFCPIYTLTCRTWFCLLTSIENLRLICRGMMSPGTRIAWR
jgi:S-adenosylmethionine synthetase family protein